MQIIHFKKPNGSSSEIENERFPHKNGSKIYWRNQISWEACCPFSFLRQALLCLTFFPVQIFRFRHFMLFCIHPVVRVIDVLILPACIIRWCSEMGFVLIVSAEFSDGIIVVLILPTYIFTLLGWMMSLNGFHADEIIAY